MVPNTHPKQDLSVSVTSEAKPKCGIVMPISAIEGCAEHHWTEVLGIVRSSVEAAGFEPNLVSDADEVGFINKRIVQNIYENPIVVCDVSCKNPNVMFELGMRLAFDKPTVIIKDDKTAYSFDIGGIEHLPYPRDLRFGAIVDFKLKLTEKLKATSVAAATDPSYTTFLKHFGEFVVAKLDRKEVSSQEYVIEELRSIRENLNALRHSQLGRRLSVTEQTRIVVGRLKLDGADRAANRRIREEIESHPEVVEAKLITNQNGVFVEFAASTESISRLLRMFTRVFPNTEIESDFS